MAEKGHLGFELFASISIAAQLDHLESDYN
jgi:hypothetical protein